MTEKGDTDRREFYRIYDHIGLELAPLKDDEPLPEDPFDDGFLADIMEELHRLDQEIRNNLPTLAERDRLTASLIKALNHRVDALARIMTFEQNPLQPKDWMTVTLSEGGVAFPYRGNELEIGSRAAARLTLPPELYRATGVITIISASRDEDGGQWLHGEFSELEEVSRQRIARHVMQWQIRQRQMHQREPEFPQPGSPKES